MEQSPTISIEQDSSPITISRDSSEKSLNKIHKFEKWRRITRRIVQFFRYISIPILRSRFIDMINHICIDDFPIDEWKNYDTKKLQEDLAFLDDIKRYREVFNTFSSFGFVWQDKEFRLAKLKANYIYDRYMSTSEAIAKTNIPVENIPFITNRMNSPRIFSSLVYLNLYNDAEKFINEKLLMIYMRTGLNGSSKLIEKSIISRNKGNQIPNESVSPADHLKEKSTIEKSIPGDLNTKPTLDSQYDEIIIPNWTYSIGSGVVYNPIREKCLKVTKRTATRKTKTVESNVNPMIKLNDSIPNEEQRFDSKSPSRTHGHLRTNPVPLSTTDRSFSKFSYRYSRCDHVFHKNMFDKRRISQEIFICKVHSSSWPQSIIQSPYRMAFQSQIIHISPRTNSLCP